MKITDYIIKQSSTTGQEFDALRTGDWFVYEYFPAWKVTDTVAVFAIRSGKFIRAKRYNNCLSVGTWSKEYATFDDAADVDDRWKEANI